MRLKVVAAKSQKFGPPFVCHGRDRGVPPDLAVEIGTVQPVDLEDGILRVFRVYRWKIFGPVPYVIIIIRYYQ